MIPFDQMPPCDDCLQRARRHGSYGDVCEGLQTEECGFQMQPLKPIENYCCKHGVATGPMIGPDGTLMGPNGPIMGPNGPSLLIVNQHHSYEEQEEVEAVESSVQKLY